MNSFGNISYGNSRFGILKESEVISIERKLLLDANGQQCSGRAYDPLTNDYKMDADGNLLGTSTASQKILLLFKTSYGSTYVENFGLKLSTTGMIPGLTGKIKQELETALKTIPEMSIVQLNVTRRDSRIEIYLEYRDNETGNLENLSI